ncbi:MAG: hypothetical protein COA36_09800 [Desulfotalea sp.]|nr:MAG: hypothetical protein COA36_09800 [Desulfotalea sp.]
MSKGYKRKYLVDASFQLSQVSVLIVANVLIILLISALLSWFYLIAWDGSTAYNHNQRIPIYIAVITALIIISTVFLSFRRSRSIAGMMKKIQVVLEDAALGILPERKLTFRKGDHFQQLATPLNDCIELLRKRPAASADAIINDLQILKKDIGAPGTDSKSLQTTISNIIQKMQ